MRELNATACAALYDSVEWSSLWNVVTLTVLVLVAVMVIIGNVLVILAVCYTSKLRNVTNIFIVSLAVADLMVGTAVLPFSAAWEVFNVWIFGDFWCSVWLAVDVWMCTASILNLCAISLDRYLAVTRPVSYPQLMSTKRARLLVAAVWVLSFVICFPPLVGWKDKRAHPAYNVTFPPYGPSNTTTILVPIKPCPWICELTNDTGYVLYSALGSFYIPMLVMLFFYWRIYNAAVSTTKAINRGFLTTKATKMFGSRCRFDEQRLTLRIHRGPRCQNGNNNGTSKSPDSGRNSIKQKKITISVSCPSPETGDIPVDNLTNLVRTPSTGSRTSVIYINGQAHTQINPNTHLQVGDVNRVDSTRQRRISCESQLTGDEMLREMPGGEEKPKMKMGKRHLKAQVRHVKRFRMETKAAKTLGIIVGGFVLCWLPFFTMYVVRAFWPNSIHPTVFSVLFWLGYCNSAINPCIYALFSKDFRFAFKRIICKCFCKQRADTPRRGSDGSQLAIRNERGPIYAVRVTQQGTSIDDSDPDPASEPTHSASESR